MLKAATLSVNGSVNTGCLKDKLGVNLQQAFSIKHVGIQRKWIDAFNTAKVDPVVPSFPGRLVKGIDSAPLAEIVRGGFDAELI